MTAVTLRIIGFLVVLVIGASVALYLITQDRRWLRVAWQVFKYALIVAGVVLAFLVLERLILAV
jgi:hypothetical protein